MSTLLQAQELGQRWGWVYLSGTFFLFLYVWDAAWATFPHMFVSCFIMYFKGKWQHIFPDNKHTKLNGTGRLKTRNKSPWCSITARNEREVGQKLKMLLLEKTSSVVFCLAFSLVLKQAHSMVPMVLQENTLEVFYSIFKQFPWFALIFQNEIYFCYFKKL